MLKQKQAKQLEKVILISGLLIGCAMLYFGSRQTREQKYHVYPAQIIKGIEEARNSRNNIN